MDKKLSELTVADFTMLCASKAPAPGGGSVSALFGALGMGLGVMTTELTIGRKKFAAVEGEMMAARDAGLPLTEAMIHGIDEDTDAFNLVMDAMGLPKATDEEKAARKAAIEDATKKAALVPLELMRRCESVTLLLEGLLGKVNPNCASDLGVGALSVKTALHGAWLNVLINIGGIADESFSAACREQGQALIDSLDPKLDAIYEAVLRSL